MRRVYIRTMIALAYVLALLSLAGVIPGFGVLVVGLVCAGLALLAGRCIE